MHALLLDIDRFGALFILEPVHHGESCGMGSSHLFKDGFIFKRFKRLIRVFVPFIACPLAPPAADAAGRIDKHAIPVGVQPE